MVERMFCRLLTWQFTVLQIELSCQQCRNEGNAVAKCGYNAQ